MKQVNLLCLTTFLMLVFSCTSDPSENESKEDIPQKEEVEKQEVKVKLQSGYEIREDAEGYDMRTIFSQLRFDQNGNKIAEKYFNSDGYLLYRDTFLYDNTVLIEELRYHSGESISARTIFTYNNKGLKTESIKHNSDKEVMLRTTFDYDSLGNNIHKTTYSSKGKVITDNNYRYNENNDKAEDVQYDSDGKLNLSYAYVYDAAGNNYMHVGLDSKGDTSFKYVYTFDNNGRKKAWQGTNSKGKIYTRGIYRYEFH